MSSKTPSATTDCPSRRPPKTSCDLPSLAPSSISVGTTRVSFSATKTVALPSTYVTAPCGTDSPTRDGPEARMAAETDCPGRRLRALLSTSTRTSAERLLRSMTSPTCATRPWILRFGSDSGVISTTSFCRIAPMSRSKTASSTQSWSRLATRKATTLFSTDWPGERCRSTTEPSSGARSTYVPNAPRVEPPSAAARCCAAESSAFCSSSVARATSASRAVDRRFEARSSSRVAFSSAARLCAFATAMSACAWPSSALSISAITSPFLTGSPSTFTTLLTMPRMRVPTAATCSGSKVTVPTTLTSGVSSAFATGASFTPARSRKAGEKTIDLPSRRGTSRFGRSAAAVSTPPPRPFQKKKTAAASASAPSAYAHRGTPRRAGGATLGPRGVTAPPASGINSRVGPIPESFTPCTCLMGALP